MSEGVDFGIRLQLEGAQQVQAGASQAEQAVTGIERATVRLQASQAALAQATAKAREAQDALNKATASGDKNKAEAAANALAAANARQAQAALAARDAQVAAEKQAASLGKTAALTGHQVAQMSAQLQDLFIQIQAGGNPMTALLQQGSQLSAVFGGAGQALRAVASLLSPAVLGFAALGAAVGAVVYSYASAERERSAFQRGLVLTGNAAGQTVDQLNSTAAAVGRLVGGQAAAADALAQYAASGQRAGASLGLMAEAALRLQRVGGPAVEETMQSFVALAKDPLQASLKLNDSTNHLTLSLYKQIKALQEQGDAVGAARIAQQAFADESISRSKQIEGSLGSLERGWLKVKDAVTAVKEAFLGIGRPEDSSAQLASLEAKLRVAEAAPEDQRSADRTRFINSARAQIEALRLLIYQEGEAAQAAADRAEAAKKGIKADQDAADATKKHAEELRNLIDAGRQLVQGNALEAAGFSGSFLRDMQALQAYAKAAGLSTEQLTQAIDALVKKQPFAAAAAKAEADAQRAVADAIGKALAERERHLESLDRATEAQARAVQALQDELYALQFGQAALQERVLLRKEEEVATLELAATKALLERSDAAEYQALRARASALQREIDLRREIAGEKTRQTTEAEAAKAAIAAQHEWQLAADSIQTSLTDAFRRAFESGGDFGATMARGLEREIKARLATALSTALAGGVVSLVAGAPRAISAAQGGVNVLGLASDAASLFAGGAASSLATAAASAGRLLGSTTLTEFAVGLKGGSLAAGLAGPTTAGAGGAMGLGSTLAAAAPYIAAAVALYAAKDVLFGRKLKDTSIVGEIGGSAGFEAETERFYKGGLFRSNKTTREALGADIADPIAEAAKAAQQGVSAYAQALGLPVEQVAGYTQAIKFSTQGLSADQIQAKLQEALGSFGDGLADLFGDQLLPFAKAGEKAGDTLARLAQSLQAVNPVLDQLNLRLLDASAAGGAAASQLAEAFGGAEQFASAAASYYGQFYSEAERAQLSLAGISETLSAAGLQVPATRDAFRGLVDGIVEGGGLMTEQGRVQFAALVQVADAFAALVPAAESAEEATRRQAEAAERVATERLGLEERLLQMQGDTAELRRREVEALDPANRALLGQIHALEDQARAADEAAVAAQQLTDSLDAMLDDLRSAAEQALDGVRSAIDRQRDALQGAYDVAVRGIDQQIQAAQDAYAAEAKRIESERELARADYEATVDPLRSRLQELSDQAAAQAELYDSERGALQAERDAVQETYQAAADALQETINAQQSVVQGLRGLTSTLGSTLRQLRPIGSEATDRARAQQQISQALAAARTTGQLPTSESLSGALQAITRPSEGLFASFEDYARDFYRTQIDIRDLSDLAGGQLAQAESALEVAVSQREQLATHHEEDLARLDGMLAELEAANALAREQIEAERSSLQVLTDSARVVYDQRIAQLDSSLALAEQQRDATTAPLQTQKDALAAQLDIDLSALEELWSQAQARFADVVGTNTAALGSVAEAIAALNSALGTLAAAMTPGGPAQIPTGQWVTSGNTQVWADPSGAVATKVVGQESSQAIIQTTTGGTLTVADAQQFVSDQLAGGNAGSLAATGAQVGISTAGVDALSGFTPGTTAALSDPEATIAGFTAAELRATLESLVAQNDLRRVYDLALQYGLTSNTVDALGGWPLGTSLSWALSQGLPAFASGGDHRGGLRIVGEQGPELEATGPSRIFSFDQLMQMAGSRGPQEALVAEVRALRADLEALRQQTGAEQRAIASHTSETARVLRRWDGDGMPETRVAVA